jgi:hypothetical protein
VRILIALFVVLFSWLVVCSNVMAQPGREITVSGKAFDSDNPQLRLEQVMVINLRTQQGQFAQSDNSFRVQAQRNDTLIITAIGYRICKICFRDSLGKDAFEVMVALEKLSYELKEATVFIPRDLNRIEQDLKKLGYSPKDYRLSGVNAWQSPLTALYQEFSRKERSKRKVAELMNADKRRELMREVLANYSRSGLIGLPYNEYDAFIDYLGLSDFLLRTFTQYELAYYIKQRYLEYDDQ